MGWLGWLERILFGFVFLLVILQIINIIITG